MQRALSASGGLMSNIQIMQAAVPFILMESGAVRNRSPAEIGNVVCPQFTKIGLVRKILTDILKYS
ncbi:MAG: hypothetical protein D3922_14580 [Candidatus Electrothrix sp. AR1]|nr:hypothetical protein [Candidatus Electrothrix sp. AR1]